MEFRSASMSQLKEFGLSTYAARAYLALLQLGVAEARGVSELANIPTAKVYGTLVQLQRRGFVQISPGKPRKYAPVAIEEFLRREIEEQEAQASQLRARAAEVASLFPLVGNASLPDKAHTITLSGKRNIIQRLREACDEAQESIFAIMAPDLRADSTMRRLIEKTAQRGIDVHILMDASPDQVRTLASSLPAAHFDRAPAGVGETILIATFDEDRAMLMHLVAQRNKSGPTHEVAIHTTERAFVQLLRRVIAMQCVLQQRLDPRAVSPAAHASPDAGVNSRAFDEKIGERAARPAIKASAVILASDAADVVRHRLWPVATGAGQARVLLGLPPRRALDLALMKRIPPHVEVKLLRAAPSVAFAVLDGDHAFLMSPARGDGHRRGDLHYAVTTETAIVRAFEAHFEASWGHATPIPSPAGSAHPQDVGEGSVHVPSAARRSPEGLRKLREPRTTFSPSRTLIPQEQTSAPSAQIDPESFQPTREKRIRFAIDDLE